jgi:hypothetical protein
MLPEIDPAKVLAAIHDRVGDLAFTVSELITHCVVDEELAEALGELTPRRLGKLLRKNVGKDLGGLTIERVGDQGGVAIWGVRQTHLATFKRQASSI